MSSAILTGTTAERFARAVQQKLSGEYDEAENLLMSIIREEPSNAEAFHEIGLVYSFRVHDNTLPALEKAVYLAPTNVKYIVTLGKTYAMFGEDDKARVAFNRALELDPFNDEAQKNLSYLG
ncbi:MAG: hypothetical protein WCP07_06990 [bacterium]|jgi:tetratricopeptide (TPR) repeat protein